MNVDSDKVLNELWLLRKTELQIREDMSEWASYFREQVETKLKGLRTEYGVYSIQHIDIDLLSGKQPSVIAHIIVPIGEQSFEQAEVELAEKLAPAIVMQTTHYEESRHIEYRVKMI